MSIMKCLICQKEFAQKHYNQKLCSRECTRERKKFLEKRFYYNNREARLKYEKERNNNAEYKLRKQKYDKKRRETLFERISENGEKRRNLLFFGGNRNKALKRDNYECQVCGNKDKLVVHHIDGTGFYAKCLATKDKTNNNMDNLQTLCRSCHAIIHKNEQTQLYCRPPHSC